MSIKLEDGCVVTLEGESGYKDCDLKDPALMIFNIMGWLYAENGEPLPLLIPAPKVSGMIGRQAALDYGLKSEYDPNSGYSRRGPDGTRISNI